MSTSTSISRTGNSLPLLTSKEGRTSVDAALGKGLPVLDVVLFVWAPVPTAVTVPVVTGAGVLGVGVPVLSRAETLARTDAGQVGPAL